MIPASLAYQAPATLDEAIALLADLTHRDTLADFLTLPAYERID